MGTFFHPITIVGPNGEETVEALVDTGVMFAELPSPVLTRLGIVAESRKYRDGRGLAQVRARLGGHEGWAMCIFANSDSEPKLGRHTLDCFILDIDLAGHLVPKVLREVRHF
jgi:hypothetical protein